MIFFDHAQEFPGVEGVGGVSGLLNLPGPARVVPSGVIKDGLIAGARAEEVAEILVAGGDEVIAAEAGLDRQEAAVVLPFRREGAKNGPFPIVIFNAEVVVGSHGEMALAPVGFDPGNGKGDGEGNSFVLVELSGQVAVLLQVAIHLGRAVHLRFQRGVGAAADGQAEAPEQGKEEAESIAQHSDSG